MDERMPMLWARVDQEFFDEAKAAAKEHYDGNMSTLVRQAVKRFLRALESSPVEVSVVDGPERELTVIAS
jgi:hypothetical protein